MSDFKHTSGPWMQHQYDEYDEIKVIKDEGPGQHLGIVVVAEMGQDGDRGYADARLIAAAPDLLELAIMGGNVMEALSLFDETNSDADWVFARRVIKEFGAKRREVMAKVAGVP